MHEVDDTVTEAEGEDAVIEVAVPAVAEELCLMVLIAPTSREVSQLRTGITCKEAAELMYSSNAKD